MPTPKILRNLFSLVVALFAAVAFFQGPSIVNAQTSDSIVPASSPTPAPTPAAKPGVLVAKQNYLEMVVGEDRAITIVDSNDNGVKDVYCRVFGESGFDIRIPVQMTDSKGEFKIVAKRPAVGLIVKCSLAEASVDVLITEIKIGNESSLCGRLDEMRGVGEHVAYFLEQHPGIGKEAIRKILLECERDRIEVSPSILDYKTVRANYGKGIGENFIVIQINVQNKSGSSKFFLQNAEAALDPKRCDLAADYFDGIYLNDIEFRKSISVYEEKLRAKIAEPNPDPNEIKTFSNTQETRVKAFADAQKSLFKTKCIDKFVEHFQYPITLGAISREKVIGLAKNELHKSPRKIAFQIANFVSAMTPVLGGLGWLGRDLKTGMGFLGTTIIPEADKGIPNVGPEKMQQLENSMKTGEIVIDPGKSETINIFVEARYFFERERFENYRTSIKKSDVKDLEFNRLLKLFLIASVDGIMIPNDSPTVKSKNGGGILVDQGIFGSRRP